METRSPIDTINFIERVIKDRGLKKQATFFTIKLENGDSITPMTGREEGSTFKDSVIGYLTGYNVNALIVELFSGKSPSVKGPFEKHRIALNRTGEVSISGVRNDFEITPAETVISPDKYINSVLLRERQITDLITRNTLLEKERDELKQKNKKKKKKIEELETELGRQERAKNKSFGNITLGNVASNALESFAKSDFGIGLLKNVFGAKQDVINGLLGIDQDSETTTEQKTKATVVIEKEPEIKKELSQEEKIRLEIIKHIRDFLKGSNDAVLRLYYELINLMRDDVALLQSIYSQVKAFKKNPVNNSSEKEETGEHEEDKNKTTNIKNLNPNADPEDIDDS